MSYIEIKLGLASKAKVKWQEKIFVFKCGNVQGLT